MTDRELMVERIQNAIQALDRAHAAKGDLRKDINTENIEAFRAHMQDLYNELDGLKRALEHQALYGEDELINLFSQLFSGKPTPYRHVAEVEHKK
jgi:hypothetical protein